ncbi:MAG: MGMT family protein [bacterium]
MNFKEKVLAIVRKIPQGNVLTYKEVAEKADSPNAPRAVGTVMKNNYDLTVPCHRVIRSDRHVGEYNRGGESAKIALLKKEGVKFNGTTVLY